MPNFFEQYGYSGDENRPVTPDDRADPANTGLSDPDIVAARQPASNFFDQFGFEEQPAAAAPPPEKPNWFANLGRMTADRAGKMLGEMTFGVADTIGDLSPDWLNAGIVWDENGLRVAKGDDYSSHSLVANVADVLRDPQRQIVTNQPSVSFDDVKNAPDKVEMAKRGSLFALENGIASVPDMIGILANAPSYFAGLASQYTQQRAANDGRDKPSAGDAVIGTGTAAVVAALEKFGAEHVLGVLSKGDKTGFRRFMEGVLSETATEAAQNPVELAGTTAGTEAGAKLTAGDYVETAASGALGGLGGAVGIGGPVHAAQALIGGSKAPAAGPLNDLENAKPAPDAIVAAQEKARADVASRGGDKLDQEVAAALAGAEISSHRRGAHDITAAKIRQAQQQLKIEQEYAEGTAQSEEDSARAQIQSEAAARYESGIPAPAQAPLEVVKTTPEVRVQPSEVSQAVMRRPENPAAQVAEKEAQTRRDADFPRAEAQKATQQATTQAYAGEPLRAPISEFKTLGERRAAAVKPNAAVSVGKSSESPEVNPDEKTHSEFLNKERLALPPPKTARFETTATGETRAVSEAELAARSPGKKPTLAIKTREQPMTRAFEAAPRTLAERRAAEQAKTQEIDNAAAQAASSPKNTLAEPSRAQRDAGNYKMGHVKVHGMDISIETPKGGLRTFRNPDGVPGQRRMRDHYGYIRRTEGADGDHVDAFVGDKPDSGTVYVIDQVKPDGTFDEHKAMLGYASREDAVRAYSRNYQAGHVVGPVTEMKVAEFKKWAETGDTKSPLKPDEVRMRRTLAQRRAAPKGETGRLAEGEQSIDPSGLKEVFPGFKRIPVGTTIIASHGLKYAKPTRGKVVGTRLFQSPTFDKETYKRTGKTEMLALPLVDFGDGKPRAVLPDGIVDVMKPTTLEARRRGEELGKRRAELGEQLHRSLNDPELADGIEHNEETGQTTVSTPEGEVDAQEDGKYLKIKRADAVVPGKGFGAKAFAALVQHAKSRGLTLASDVSVSPSAARVYDALERRGYKVKRNPADVNETTGNLVSRDPRVPVFEVSPASETQNPEAADLPAERRARPREGDASLAKPRDDSFTVDTASDQRRISVERAEAHLKPLLDEVGREGIAVIAHPRDLPTDLRTKLIAQVGQRRLDNARGLYDPATDTVHVFSENHQTEASLTKTAIHEIVAHQGVRKLLGKDHPPLMMDVFKNAKDRAWMTDFMHQHGLRGDDPQHQVLAADEYVASISERQEDRSAFEKVATAVRAVLRKLGIVDKWTEADIHRLLAKSRTALREASAHGRAAGPYGVRLAEGEKENPKTDASHPTSRLFKMNVSAEDQSNYNPGFVRSRLDALETKGANGIPLVLATIPRRNLPDFMPPGAMPSTQAYIRQAQRLDGRRNELLQAADNTASKWLKYTTKNKDVGRVLGELMHAATLGGVDPAGPYFPKFKNPKNLEQRQAEAQRRGQYNALKKHWDAMPGEAKAIYIEVRDAYAAHRDLVMQGLEARINAAQADGKTKQALIGELRQKFEAGRVAGPYFPLARFGKYWAVAKDKAGEVVAYTRFENIGERRAWVAQMKQEGHVVDTGVKSDEASVAKRVDPNFVAKIAGMLDEIDPEMADDVWQQYLRALPEMSMRRHFIHRKGRLGFTADALRAFAHQQFHSAHQIAKLEHMGVLDSLVEQIAVESKKQQGSKDEIWASSLADEFSKRHQWAKNPTSSLWATKLTALGFGFYLGLTPAAALVNFTQTPMVALPTLAAKYNYLGAGTELGRAAAQWAGSRGPLVNRLRGDEQKAFMEAQRIGLFEKTMSHDLAGLSEEGSTDYGSTRQKVANAVSWMFHKTEEGNRQVTYLAAYRLARRKGMNHEQAILSAEDITWDSHFDYANVNRPRVLQNDAAKVLLLFRQYSLNMTYRLARDFNDSLRSASPQQRNEARQRFAGIVGQAFLFAGASGMPMYWLVKLVCDSLFGSKDEPFDTEAAMRAHLAEQYGVKASHAIMDGPVGSLAGVDLSSRVGLNGLWWREPPSNLEGEDLGMFYLKEAAGPLPSIAINAFEAASLSTEGFGDRSAEKLSPKVISDALKSLRYAREGVANKRGDVLVPREEISNYELFVQSLGFTPDRVALQYEQNRVVKAAEQHIESRRAQLLNNLALARQNDDDTAWDETMADINKFNQVNPGRGISAPTIIGSAKARGRYSAESVNGIRVEPGLRYLHEKLNFTEEKPE